MSELALSIFFSKEYSVALIVCRFGSVIRDVYLNPKVIDWIFSFFLKKISKLSSDVTPSYMGHGQIRVVARGCYGTDLLDYSGKKPARRTRIY